jgi:hypothetical protein
MHSKPGDPIDEKETIAMQTDCERFERCFPSGREWFLWVVTRSDDIWIVALPTGRIRDRRKPGIV